MSTEQVCKKNTENFLRSYFIQKAMSTVNDFDKILQEEEYEDIPSASIKEFDYNLQPGQIRLLADLDHLTYIALLQRCKSDDYVTVAFSHYDFPATNEEIIVDEYNGAYIKVLQLWNTKVLPDYVLKKSWLCGILSDEVCKIALDFWQSNGEIFPNNILERSGTAIAEEDDVRLEYMREERKIFDVIDSAIQSRSDVSTNHDNILPDWLDEKYILPPLWELKDNVLAAGNEEDVIHVNCRIDGKSELFVVDYSPAEGILTVNVFKEDLSDFASTFDDAEIIDPSGNVLGVIKNGQFRKDGLKNFDGSLGIRDIDGIIFNLFIDGDD